MPLPEVGQRVHVWPMPDLRVSSHAPPVVRVLPPDGAICCWSQWLAKRIGAGEISLTDPRRPGDTPSSLPSSSDSTE